MRTIFTLISLLLFTGTFAQEYQGTIVSVTDGDTYIFQTEYGSLRVRSEGIDAPETVQPYGKAATAFMETFLNTEATLVTSGTDRYKRTIGTLYIGGKDINLAMIDAGLAWFYKAYSENEAYQKAETTARAKAIGLWSMEPVVAPWDWRNKKEKYPGPELSEGEVIICTSKGAYTYHKYYCKGLKRCKVDMKVISKSEAKEMGRKECSYCY